MRNLTICSAVFWSCEEKRFSRGYVIPLSCTKSVPITQKNRDELKTHPLNPLQSVISNWQQRPPRPLLIKPRDSLICTHLLCNSLILGSHVLSVCKWSTSCATGFRDNQEIEQASKPICPWMTPNSGMRRNSARLRQSVNYLRGVHSERHGLSLRRKTRPNG